MPSPPQQPSPAPAPAPAQESGQPPAPRTGDEMPSSNELLDIGAKSLQTGVLTGTLGAAIGAGSGIMRNAPPALFALFAGLQWFALGSSFMASRSLLWHAWGGEENLSSGDKVKAGAVAGGVSGMVGGMARGPSNILPGIFFFSTLAGTSTFIAQKFQNKEPKEKTSWMASKWSPMKQLTDQEYEKILEERLLRLNAEIAIIDENIASLKGTTAKAATTPAATAPAAKAPEAVVPEPDDKPKARARPFKWWSS